MVGFQPTSRSRTGRIETRRYSLFQVFQSEIVCRLCMPHLEQGEGLSVSDSPATRTPRPRGSPLRAHAESRLAGAQCDLPRPHAGRCASPDTWSGANHRGDPQVARPAFTQKQLSHPARVRVAYGPVPVHRFCGAGTEPKSPLGENER